MIFVTILKVLWHFSEFKRTFQDFLKILGIFNIFLAWSVCHVSFSPYDFKIFVRFL